MLTHMRALRSLPFDTDASVLFGHNFRFCRSGVLSLSQVRREVSFNSFARAQLALGRWS